MLDGAILWLLAGIFYFAQRITFLDFEALVGCMKLLVPLVMGAPLLVTVLWWRIVAALALLFDFTVSRSVFVVGAVL